MGKSENGPDMQDCCLYLADIEQQTGWRVTALLERAGYGAGSFWLIHVLAIRGRPGEVEESAGVSVAMRWPHREHATFSGAMYAAIAALDGEIGRKVFQEVLNIT
jgi:hypothetical protein